jgi:CubicO group peptidase (beta-lactamase class C family)
MSNGPQREGLGEILVGEIDQLFTPWNRNDTPGLVVGVQKDGSVVYRRGFGMASLETGVANTPKTKMRIASITKHFTCLLALLLEEEGRLDLDCRIRTYLPELAGPAGDPTLRQLMQHRGGSRCAIDIGILGHGMTPSPKGTALATLVRQRGCNFLPGQAMIYNNGGYELVSIAIERASGRSFGEFLKDRLLKPLGLQDTEALASDYTITPGMATLHQAIPGGGWRRGLFPSDENAGAGSIISTIDDMLRWAAHLRTRDRFGAPASWAALTELPMLPDGATGGYGLGLILEPYRGLPILHHAGGWMGGVAQLLTFPDNDLDIVIMTNGAPGADPVKLAQQIADIVLCDQLGEVEHGLPAAGRERELGNWWSPENSMIYQVLEDDGRLQLSLCGFPYGFPLELGADGWIATPASNMGRIEVKLVEAEGSDGLAVRFGGAADICTKLTDDPVDAGQFEALAPGCYRSDEADQTAEITRSDEGLLITFSDPWGRQDAVLHPLTPTLARMVGASPYLSVYGSLGLMLEARDVTGFRLNTLMSRNMVFERV